LEYAPSSQNQRVSGYEIPGDEQPRQYTTDNLLSKGEMDDLITAAYRQIFHEQQMLTRHRQTFLESQLRSGQITVKEFIRGLVLSDPFRRLNYETNNNYRFVEMCVQRVLGRNVYSDREKLAWSTVLATQGLNGFVNALINSDEYQANFGNTTVPFQRRRILPTRLQGELPFERMARYGEDYRDNLPKPSLGSFRMLGQFEQFDWDYFQGEGWSRVAGLAIAGFVLVFFLLAISAGIAGS
jgi:phycobilisome rod-core linker protein